MFVVFVKVCVTLACGVETAEAPVIFALLETVHVYCVPAGTKLPLPFEGATVNAVPEQMVAVVF